MPQAASGVKAREDISAQLRVWNEQGLTPKIEPGLTDIYNLLSGHPERVIENQSLDWRRSLGLYLW